MSTFAGTATARIGWGDPDVFGTLMGLRVEVIASAGGPLADLSSVVSADFYVEREGGVVEVWDAVVEAMPNTTTMTLFHAYAETDLVKVETLKITPRLHTADDIAPCTPFRLNVVR